MGGWIKCENGHRVYDMLLHDAAIKLSQNRLGKCGKHGKSLHYHVCYKRFANDPKAEEQNYEVIKAVRLFPRKQKDGFDPFLLLLQHEDNPRDRKVLPTFWAPDRKGGIRGGQFPPLLATRDWRTLFRKLDIRT